MGGGGLPIIVVTGLAGDNVRSVNFRFCLQRLCTRVLWKSATSVETVVPPRVSIPYDDGDAATGQFLTGKAGDQANVSTRLGFYFQVFLVPKENGKLWPVINLCLLNQCLLCPHFQMETVASITLAIQPGDWAASLDLMDVYFHAPIASWFWKYLHFIVNG